MDLQTESMRSTKERSITAWQHPEDGQWSGVEFVNHPTPSGSERWLPTVSDNRRWPDEKTAIAEFTKTLPKPPFEIEKKEDCQLGDKVPDNPLCKFGCKLYDECFPNAKDGVKT